MDRGVWRLTLGRVTKSETRLEQLSTYACIGCKGLRFPLSISIVL